jgi:predicted RNase H-like nuclease (RuvC/YqgF family)
MTPQQEEWMEDIAHKIITETFLEGYDKMKDAIKAALRAAIEQQQGKEDDEESSVTKITDADRAQWHSEDADYLRQTVTRLKSQLSAAEAKVKELEAQLIDIDNLRMSADRRVAELEGKRAKPLKVDHPNGKDYGSLFRLQEAIRQLPEHGNQLHGLLCDFLDELEGKERQIAVKRTADNELTICRHDENGTHYVIFAEADDKSHSYVRVGNTPKDYETLQDFWLENILRKFFEFNSSNQKEKE